VVISLDSSAIVKLVHREPEPDELLGTIARFDADDGIRALGAS
jgi:hypothetical protein